ncbi:exodeoxyribonuclease V subunit alpha [bacterium]|nr:MAG: exodeoxyribonuclease V subunit alpha [bacterium]
MIDWNQLAEEEIISPVLVQMAQTSKIIEDQVAVFLAFKALESGNTVFSKKDYPHYLPAVSWEKSSLIGSPTDEKPIKKLDETRFQIQRLWVQEQGIKAFLNQTSDFISGIEPDVPFIKQIVGEHDSLSVQAKAMQAILNERIVILTGGPGTGKTFTIVRLLASLIHHFTLNKNSIALTAPTGKAAARMLESIHSSLVDLPVDEAFKAQFPNEAFTIHRLLGITNNALQSTYNKKNRLPFDCVIVDESSMLDVNLFYALTQALKPNTKLVLVGDSDQLPSVEAGFILADLCSYGDDVQVVLSDSKGQTDLFTSEKPDNKCATIKRIHLSKSHRFSEKSSIGILAKKVNQQEADTLLETFQLDDLNWISVNNIAEMNKAVKQWYQQHLEKLQSANSEKELFSVLREQMIISGLRVGSWGSEGINQLFSREFERLGKGSKHGFPIIINTNSYSHQLFNSDIGVYVEKESTNKIVFEERLGVYRRFNPGVIQTIIDPAFAMTVHKSQGSEYDHIMLVLPEKDENRLLSKELIYTAITRAKKTFTLVSNKDIFVKAVKTLNKRETGLRA